MSTVAASSMSFLVGVFVLMLSKRAASLLVVFIVHGVPIWYMRICLVLSGSWNAGRVRVELKGRGFGVFGMYMSVSAAGMCTTTALWSEPMLGISVVECRLGNLVVVI